MKRWNYLFIILFIVILLSGCGLKLKGEVELPISKNSEVSIPLSATLSEMPEWTDSGIFPDGIETPSVVVNTEDRYVLLVKTELELDYLMAFYRDKSAGLVGASETKGDVYFIYSWEFNGTETYIKAVSNEGIQTLTVEFYRGSANYPNSSD